MRGNEGTNPGDNETANVQRAPPIPYVYLIYTNYTMKTTGSWRWKVTPYLVVQF